jgi:hypothetical protein
VLSLAQGDKQTWVPTVKAEGAVFAPFNEIQRTNSPSPSLALALAAARLVPHPRRETRYRTAAIDPTYIAAVAARVLTEDANESAGRPSSPPAEP